MSETQPVTNFYPYSPSHVLPAVFTALVGISLLIHTYQNFHYRFWRVTFFMFYAGAVFTVGWISRVASSYNTASLNLYIVQTVFILAAPPIYSAAEYNILSRLMNYVPMHAPLHPRRVYIFFIYLGAAVESLTAAGGAMIATSSDDVDKVRFAGTLISIALVLQGAVELLFISFVALIHTRCSKSHMLTPNIRSLCIMLYGTSTLIIFRCVFRAIDSFATRTPNSDSCGSLCRNLHQTEWYLYAFEAAPMVLYTFWINIVHPGTLLPRQRNRYLDTDGRTERMGPGWIDRRSRWETFMDPFDLSGTLRGQPNHEKFWETPEKYPACNDGSFATKTATNTSGGNEETSHSGSTSKRGWLNAKQSKGGEQSGSRMTQNTAYKGTQYHALKPSMKGSSDEEDARMSHNHGYPSANTQYGR